MARHNQMLIFKAQGSNWPRQLQSQLMDTASLRDNSFLTIYFEETDT